MTIRVVREVGDDLRELARVTQSSASPDRGEAVGAAPSRAALLRLALSSDGFKVLVLTRLREASRRWHIPGVNHLLRLVTTVLFSVEVGNDIQLGRGVNFTHTLGTVVGGTSVLGDRVTLLGNNTIGTAKDNGCPVIGNDVVIGCGARVLGPVRIGDGAFIGANAVVLDDVPAGATATGIPAVVRHTTDSER
jgi:serine O-acetyltransferase